MKMIVNAPYKLRGQQDVLDVIINVYRVNLTDLRRGIAGGLYQILSGSI